MDTLVQDSGTLFKTVLAAIQSIAGLGLGAMICIAFFANLMGGERGLRAAVIVLGCLLIMYMVIQASGGIGTGLAGVIPKS